MTYGYFDNANKEYVITRPDTPTPWMNYLGKGGFSGIISNTAGGLCFDADPSNRRVMRYKFNNLPKDRPGRYLYIRDEETGEYWSPTWQPVLKDLQHYECRHGLGYTVITGTYNDVKTTISYCVPRGKSYELWQVSMENLSDKPKKLKIFSYIEFSWADAKYDTLSHWPCMAFAADFDRNKIVVDTGIQQLTADPMQSYISTDLDVDGYDCSLSKFIGAYRGESNPIVLEKGMCTNSSMYSNNCVGVLSSSIELTSGETKNFNYTVGSVSNKNNIDPQIADAFSKRTTTDCIKEIKADWEDYCSKLIVNTPDSDMNSMLNIWNAYQAKTTFDWSRFISFYERGADRGLGFRDSMQDVLGIMHAEPEKAKERIKLLLSIQRSNGNADKVIFPSTKKTTPGGRSDDHLWSIFSVCNYIKETGDNAFIDETVPYLDGGEDTVIGHLERGMEFTMSNLGVHGIPLTLEGDWNDSLRINWMGRQGSESAFVFFQLAHAAYELIELYTYLGLTERMEKIRKIYAYCQSNSDILWDGEWFIRAFDSYGKKHGTNDDENYKIYLNSQTWSVLSRLPDDKKANKAMDSMMKYLYTKNGLTTCFPAVDGFDFDKRAYFLFPAGARENAGIFFHSNTWAIIAHTMLGRGDEAFKCYSNISPVNRNDTADLNLTEPYVYSQTMIAPPHPEAGMCVNSWLTGTASWIYLAATQFILGIRPEYNGLCIDPKIPSDWEGFTAVRVCRGTTCNIKAAKDGEKGLYVNGIRQESNIIPWALFELSETLDVFYCPKVV